MKGVKQHDVIDDVCLTVARILEKDLKERVDGAFEVATELPDTADAKLSKPRLCVDLWYFERDGERTVTAERPVVTEKSDTGEVVEFWQGSPMFLTLHIVLSAWARTRSEQRRLLGAAIQSLHDHPVVQEDEVAMGALHVEDGIRIEWAEFDGIESQEKYWQWAGLPARPIVHYVVKKVRVDSRTKMPFKRVRETIYDYRKLE